MPNVPKFWEALERALENFMDIIDPLSWFPAMNITCTGAMAPGMLMINVLSVFALIPLFDSGLSECACRTWRE